MWRVGAAGPTVVRACPAVRSRATPALSRMHLQVLEVAFHAAYAYTPCAPCLCADGAGGTIMTSAPVTSSGNSVHATRPESHATAVSRLQLASRGEVAFGHAGMHPPPALSRSMCYGGTISHAQRGRVPGRRSFESCQSFEPPKCEDLAPSLPSNLK